MGTCVIKEQIKNERECLNNCIENNENDHLLDEEILEISRRLDLLILKYITQINMNKK